MTPELWAIAPELVLLVTASILFLGRPSRCAAITLIGLAIAAGAALPQWSELQIFYAGAYLTYPGTCYLKCLLLLGTALSVFVMNADKEVTLHRPELLGLMLIASAGGMLLISSSHLAVTYLAFEILSISSYALTGSIAGNSKSNEAGLKYAIYGGLSSAFLLYGMSLLYGVTGSLQYAVIREVPLEGLVVSIAAVFIGVGALYKLAAAPFHFWAPDAFEGAPVSVAAFLSTVPKIAGLGMLLSLTAVIGHISWIRVLEIAAVVSMTWGNLAALAQTNMKRLLAYSSVAHAGYILLAIVAGNIDGDHAAIFYMTIYLFMNIGAFYVLALLSDPTISGFRTLSFRQPVMAFSMAVFLFSLTGLPPFSGFIGKMLIVFAALKSERYLLVGVLLVNTAISLYYYARVLRAMFLEPGTSERIAVAFQPRALIPLLAGITIVLGLWWGKLYELTGRAIGLEP